MPSDTVFPGSRNPSHTPPPPLAAGVKRQGRSPQDPRGQEGCRFRLPGPEGAGDIPQGRMKSAGGGEVDATRRVQGPVACVDLEREAAAQLPEVPGSEESVSRSEERRVGKECRSRWSPDN